MGDPITRLAEALWVSWPLRIQRRFPSTRGLLGDWHGIALFPPLALLSLAYTAATYFAVGAFGIGYTNVYTESALLMTSLIALGAFSSQLGLVGLIAFALGDFLFGQEPIAPRLDGFVEGLIRSRGPLIISYLLLAVAVLIIPRIGRAFGSAGASWFRPPAEAAWLLATPLTLLVSWFGLRSWAAAGPTLIRPYWTWFGREPTVEAIQVFQVEASSLIAAGVAGTLARQVLIALFVYIPWLGQRLDRLEARAHIRIGHQPPRSTASRASRAGGYIGDAVSALLASLVLSGILASRAGWALVFFCFLLLRLLRSGALIVAPLEAWKQLTERVPAVVRIGTIWLLAVGMQNFLTDDRVGSYSRMAFIVVVAAIVGFIILPGPSRPSDTMVSAEPAGADR